MSLSPYMYALVYLRYAMLVQRCLLQMITAPTFYYSTSKLVGGVAQW